MADRSIRLSSALATGLLLASVLADCGGKSAGLTPTGMCVASTPPTTSPPYAVEFQFRNVTAAPLYVLKRCGSYGYGLSSCASGFSDRLNDFAPCNCSCANPHCGVVCGGCEADAATAIAPGDSLRRTFDGTATTVVSSPGDQCVNDRVLPAGRYRVAIEFYDSPEAALAESGAHLVTADFELPTANGLVDVPLGLPSPASCDPNPGVATRACTGGEGREQPCDLPAAISFGYEGGSVPFSDSEALTPPATDVRTRTSTAAGSTPETCTTQIPRCSLDARVPTTADVARALAAPGVAAAFGADMPIYGSDPRPVDGSIMVVTRADGKSLALGTACASGCARPLTPALFTLGTVLQAVANQQLHDPGCAALVTRP